MRNLVLPQKQYNFPKQAEEAVQLIIEDLLQQGVLIETNSEFISPIWPFLKADRESWRQTVDYQAINKGTHPMAPIMADMPVGYASRIQGSPWWFSVIDLANCFFAIPLHSESWNRFAFTFKGRQYTFARVPQKTKHSGNGETLSKRLFAYSRRH